MKIVCIGGGPGALYFSLLTKKAHPDWSITVLERNPADVTWGFGVVFSDETMEGFKDADGPTYTAITDSFVHWDDIDIHYQGEVLTSSGHGFAGMQRLKLLQILEARAREVGVEVRHGVEVTELPDADLVVAADGVNSFIRRARAEAFGTTEDLRPNKFVWLGTSKRFDAFTFYFVETEHGLWRAHCYSYMPGMSTFIVECTADTWQRAGLDGASEADTIRHCERVFAEQMAGEKLIGNNSIWRSFPRIRNDRYYDGNVVLLGDALHTAHFSIGSGTKLAMEDAVSLAAALDAHPRRLEDALAAYQADREPVVDSLQRAALVSMEWFEETERYFGRLEPLQFAYSLLTRSMRINHDNLKLRDAGFVERVEGWLAARAYAQAGVAPHPSGRTPPPIFTPLRLRELVLENRIAVSPMCMYSAPDGVVGDWHLVHLGSRAMGGAGLVYAEATAVSPEGRISPTDSGIWDDRHVAAWRRITRYIHASTRAKTCMQLSHAGRKASTKAPWEGADHPLDDDNWEVVAPSPLPYADYCHTPREMTRTDMDEVLVDYVKAAHNALEAGFDMLELHFAHGYLLSTFLSPLTNLRQDEYGGPIENRMRYPLEVFRAVRAAWPAEKPISVRISATDWKPDGFSHADALALLAALQAAGCDIVDVSAGQVVSDQKPVYGRLFQTPFSTRLRLESGMKTMTVGNVQSFGDASAIIAGGRADLVVIARMHLADPYWTRHAAYHYDWPIDWPPQYRSVARYTPRWT